MKSKGERILLVAGDPYRPAAVKQLQQLGERLDVDVEADTSITPPQLAKRALDKAEKGGYSLVIVDTAGRSQMDAGLMDELKAISCQRQPRGYPARHRFHDRSGGVEYRAGIQGCDQPHRACPHKNGWRLARRCGHLHPLGDGGADQIHRYGRKTRCAGNLRPSARLSSRILGMGDMIGLIEKAEAMFDSADHAEKQAQKMMTGGFTLEDWLDQMKQMKKMGPLAQIMDMLPGQMGQAARGIDPTVVEKSFKQSEAIINSMTLKERRNPDLLNASRRRRIAAGSGMEVQDVNRLIKQFRETQKMMKMLQKTGGKGLGRMFG
jgi:signal recognition particle subunit SRP54